MSSHVWLLSGQNNKATRRCGLRGARGAAPRAAAAAVVAGGAVVVVVHAALIIVVHFQVAHLNLLVFLFFFLYLLCLIPRALLLLVLIQLVLGAKMLTLLPTSRYCTGIAAHGLAETLLEVRGLTSANLPG